MENRRRTGAEYEQKALKYLEGQGYRILQRNYRCRLGEIDLIAWDRGTLVFVEVKYRRSEAFGSPEEAVDARKQYRICRVADYYRMTHKVSEECPCRFDVAAIEGKEIRLLRNAFPYRSISG